MAEEVPPAPRVWITSFWGFDPENEGYLGFTYEGNRSWFLGNWREGDLILIYGADAAKTEPEKRYQALGFLEIEPELISDKERMSEIGLRRKEENDWLGRWTHAVPVVRAAEITRRISISHIATKTITRDQARIIASRGALLTPEEASVALSLPVRPLNVFGMPALSPDDLEKTFTPSRGINPSFGQRTVDLQDGEHCLYALQFHGDLEAMLGLKPFEVRGQVVVKVGYTNDVERRRREHNAGFPPASRFHWKPTLKSRPFPHGQAAKDAEDVFKAELSRRGRSLGGEFFLCHPNELQSAFALASMSTAQVKIRA